LYSLLFHTLPLFGFLRAPARIGIVVTLALVVCASMAVAHLARGGRGRRVLLPAALVLLLSAELSAMPLQLPEVEWRPHPVYRTLARLPRSPVCEFPFFYVRSDFSRHAYYMVNSATHWLPLVNGYSDHIPEDFRAMVIDLSSFPARIPFALLRERRVRYVVFHLRFYDARSREKLFARLEEYEEFLAPILKEDDVWLYEIVRWP
jgi:hypothetical protein